MPKWSVNASIRLQASAILILASVLMLLGFSTLFNRLNVDLHGTIIKSDTTCDSTNAARCTSIYQIAASTTIVSYQTGPSGPMLPTRLPIGTTVAKNRWQIAYTVNGEPVDDFALFPVLVIGCRGAVLFLVSSLIIVRPTIIPLPVRKAMSNIRYH